MKTRNEYASLVLRCSATRPPPAGAGATRELVVAAAGDYRLVDDILVVWFIVPSSSPSGAYLYSELARPLPGPPDWLGKLFAIDRTTARATAVDDRARTYRRGESIAVASSDGRGKIIVAKRDASCGAISGLGLFRENWLLSSDRWSQRPECARRFTWKEIEVGKILREALGRHVTQESLETMAESVRASLV